MNIQIFGKSKCFDTKKAERYFKERRIKYQFIDILKYGISRGELRSVCQAVGMDSVVNPEDQDYPRRPLRKAARDSRDAADAHRPQRQKGHRRLLPRRLEGLGLKDRKKSIDTCPETC